MLRQLCFFLLCSLSLLLTLNQKHLHAARQRRRPILQRKILVSQLCLCHAGINATHLRTPIYQTQESRLLTHESYIVRILRSHLSVLCLSAMPESRNSHAQIKTISSSPTSPSTPCFLFSSPVCSFRAETQSLTPSLTSNQCSIQPNES